MLDDADLNNLLARWQNGSVERGEFLDRVLEAVTSDNIDELVKIMPADLLDDLKAAVADAPKTDEGWNKMFILEPWCGPWDDEIAAHHRRDHGASLQRIRQGVELLRQRITGRGE